MVVGQVPKRNANINKFNMQQFSQAPGSQTLESTGYSANVMKVARQSVGKRSTNRVTNANQNMALTKNPSIVQTIDTSNVGHVLPQHEIYNTN